MEIYLLRHGIAADLGSVGIQTDAERPLTTEGVRKMEGIASAMKAMKLEFGLMLTSPLLRARQTAAIVAAGLQAKKCLEVEPALALNGSPRDLIRSIAARKPQPGSVLLVGHEPYLSGLISLLVCGDAGFPVTMKKGGLCKLTAEPLLPGRCAVLEWLLAPKQMLLMA